MKTILIEIKADDKASSKINKVEQAVAKLGKTAKTSIIQTDSSSKVKMIETAVVKFGKTATTTMKSTSDAVHDTMGKLDALGNRFRYLSLVTGMVSGATILMAKSFVDAYSEAEKATLKLGVFAVSTGENMVKAKQAAMDLASTGIVSVSEAATGLSNLLATGIGLDKAVVLSKRMIDSTVLLKQNMSDTYGVAFAKGTLGVRTMREVMIDSIGVEAVHMQLYKKYADEIGKVSSSLTTQERQQAIINNLMKETERTIGGADLVTHTFSGSLTRLSSRINIMKIAMGETLVPVVGSFSEMITSVTMKITSFATNFSSLTTILVSGTVVVSVLIATIATLGALIPMIEVGFKGLTGAGLLLTSAAGLKAIAVFMGLAIVLGALIYLTLKATGQWDKWKNSTAGLVQRIKDTINVFKQQGTAASDANDKIAKSMKKLQESVNLTSRDFKENMKEWSKKHDETVKDLRKQINDLQKDYSSATRKIRKDFSDTMSDLTLSHTRKTEDLQRELDEEVSKGIWADQTRIREIKLSLKRENEDYARSSNEKEKIRDENLSDEKTSLDDKLAKLQKNLDDELKLEQKHARLIAEARTWPILDEIEKKTRAYTERLLQYQDELKEIQKTSSAESDALQGVEDSFNDIASAVNKPLSKLEELKQKFIENEQKAAILSSSAGRAGIAISGMTNKILEQLSAASSIYMTNVKELLTGPGSAKVKYPSNKIDIFGMIKNFFSGLSFQTGGVIPGSTEQAVPIIAHGGETVLPAGVAPVTININNPSVRESQDIQRIADAVRLVLSRQQVLRHLQ